jgi:hypothetical protein
MSADSAALERGGTFKDSEDCGKYFFAFFESQGTTRHKSLQECAIAIIVVAADVFHPGRCCVCR